MEITVTTLSDHLVKMDSLLTNKQFTQVITYYLNTLNRTQRDDFDARMKVAKAYQETLQYEKAAKFYTRCTNFELNSNDTYIFDNAIYCLTILDQNPNSQPKWESINWCNKLLRSPKLNNHIKTLACNYLIFVAKSFGQTEDEEKYVNIHNSLSLLCYNNTQSQAKPLRNKDPEFKRSKGRADRARTWRK